MEKLYFYYKKGDTKMSNYEVKGKYVKAQKRIKKIKKISKRGAAVGLKIVASLTAGAIIVVNDVAEDVVMNAENILSKDATDKMERMIDKTIMYTEPFREGTITLKEYFEIIKEA